MKQTKTRLGLAFAALCCVASMAAQAAEEPHAHHHHPMADAAAAAPLNVPPLELQMPHDGDTIGTQVAVVFKTPADLAAMTMGAAPVGVHLHVEIAGVALMPTRQQLIALGGNSYLYLFDLPAKPGANTIRVYWSDAQHRTLEATVRAVTVQVKA